MSASPVLVPSSPVVPEEVPEDPSPVLSSAPVVVSPVLVEVEGPGPVLAVVVSAVALVLASPVVVLVPSSAPVLVPGR